MKTWNRSVRPLVLSGLVLGAALSARAAQDALRTYYANDPVGRNVVSIESRAPLETILTHTGAVTGTIHVNPDNVMDGPQASFELDANTLDTGITLRNEHMRGKQWLDTAQFPKVSYTLTGIIPPLLVLDEKGAPPQMALWSKLEPGKSKTFSATGTLELHGVKRPVTAQLEVNVVPGTAETKNRLPGDLLHVRATFPIKLTDFGIALPAMAQAEVSDAQTVTADIFTSTELPKAPPQ